MATEEEAAVFFDALAGRTPGGHGTSALREALLAQQRTLDEAQHASAASLTAQEHARMEAIRQRLAQAGAWRVAPAPEAARVPTPSATHPAAPALRPQAGSWQTLWQGLRSLLLGDSWQRPMVLALGVVLASALLLRIGSGPDDDPAGVMRGPPGQAIRVADAAARSAVLAADLQAAGAEVLRVQVATRQWALSVSVPAAERVAAVERVLREAGFRIEGPPPYELNVHGAP